MAEPTDPAIPANDDDGINWGEPASTVAANIVAIVPGPYDVVMYFGREDHGHRVNGQPVRQETVRVNMSWGHLKSMVPIMANVVAAYEQQFGVIPAPGFDQMWKGEQS